MDHGTRPETERVLLQIWSDILETERVGIHDHFLDVGGDSFAAMRCINQIRATFDVELPLDVFFAEPASIASMAAELEKLRSGTAGAPQPDLPKDIV